MSAIMWLEKAWQGSKSFNYPKWVHKYPAHLASPFKKYWGWFGTVEPPRTLVKELYTSRYVSSNVVQEMFDVLGLPRTSAKARCTLCFPLKGVLENVRYDPTTPNSCFKLYTPWYLAIMKVRRRGSLHLNYPELVHKHPAHLASPLKTRFSTV